MTPDSSSRQCQCLPATLFSLRAWPSSPRRSTAPPTSSRGGARGWKSSSPSCASGRRRSRAAAARRRWSGTVARQAAGARADRPARRPWHRVPRAERARRLGYVRRRRAERGHRHRDRRRRGPRVRDRRERRDRQGRLVLPAHGQEAPARAGGRGAEPAPVPLPRRLRRRVPTAAGRCLSRP